MNLTFGRSVTSMSAERWPTDLRAALEERQLGARSGPGRAALDALASTVVLLFRAESEG